MAQLPDVVPGALIEAADVNDRYAENYLWADHVDGGGKTLSKTVLSAVGFDVCAFGAVGDGTTNDTAAVQAAVNAAAVAGGVVLFPAGKTYLLGQVNINSALRVSLLGYGAIIKPAAINQTVFYQDGATLISFSYLHIEGFLFRGSHLSGLNGVKGINLLGVTRARVVNCGFEDINWAVWLDRSNDIDVENCFLYHNTRIFAGSTVAPASPTTEWSHRIRLKGISYYPHSGAELPGFTGGGVIVFERVAGGTIDSFIVTSLRGVACGIELRNDTQGVLVLGGLIIHPSIGVKYVHNAVGSISAGPLQCQLDGLQIDQYTDMGVHIQQNVLEAEVHRVVFTGQNTPTTEQHAILNESSFGTSVSHCRFQNIKAGNGITCQANANSAWIISNRFWCQLNGTLIWLVGGTGDWNVIRDNYRVKGDTSAFYVVNASSGTHNSVAGNYDGNA